MFGKVGADADVIDAGKADAPGRMVRKGAAPKSAPLVKAAVKPSKPRTTKATRGLPTSIKPQLATLVDEAPDGSNARVARVYFRLLRGAAIARLLPLDDIIELMADALGAKDFLPDGIPQDPPLEADRRVFFDE